MLTETGRILAKDTHYIWVETIKKSTCGTCAAEKGCGQSLLAKIGLGKRRHTAIPLALAGDQSLIASLVVGDDVTLSIEDNAVVTASMIAYLLPLMTMLLFALLGQYLSFSEPVLIGLSAIGLGLGFLCVRLHAMFRSHQATYLPKITKKHLSTHIPVVTLPCV